MPLGYNFNPNDPDSEKAMYVVVLLNAIHFLCRCAAYGLFDRVVASQLVKYTSTSKTHTQFLRELFSCYKIIDLILSRPPHPYRHEIAHITFPSRMFETHTPISPKSFAETPFTWVSTSSDFATMLDKLRNAQEIAVDLEYHNYRSFGGFVCLMQISSREEDWIVDPFELRDEMEELNEVFTDPKVVKVSIVCFSREYAR